MESFISIGKKIYNLKNPREAHRYAVFVLRTLAHRGKLKELQNYFAQDAAHKVVEEANPLFYEQATRFCFYKHSSIEERIRIIKDSVDFLLTKLPSATLADIYRGENITLWEDTGGEQDNLWLWLHFEGGQKKEGLLSLVIVMKNFLLYQMIFWLGKNRQGEYSLYIGAMQGPNVSEAREVVKVITKRFYGWRPKGFILHATQEFAKWLGAKHIYAVTNEGYYANNHVRVDRKLKTSFTDFWEEVGGKPTADKRFYELPLTEERKTAEEIPTRKRALYRKRYELTDRVEESIKRALEKINESN